MIIRASAKLERPCLLHRKWRQARRLSNSRLIPRPRSLVCRGRTGHAIGGIVKRRKLSAWRRHPGSRSTQKIVEAGERTLPDPLERRGAASQTEGRIHTGEIEPRSGCPRHPIVQLSKRSLGVGFSPGIISMELRSRAEIKSSTFRDPWGSRSCQLMEAGDFILARRLRSSSPSRPERGGDPTVGTPQSPSSATWHRSSRWNWRWPIRTLPGEHSFS